MEKVNRERIGAEFEHGGDGQVIGAANDSGALDCLVREDDVLVPKVAKRMMWVIVDVLSKQE